MINALIGRKIDQKQMFLENGRRVPVTEIAVGENTVVQIKTTDKDAYAAVQLGFGQRKKPTRAESGHAKKAGLAYVPEVIREVTVRDGDTEILPEPGQVMAVASVFKPGDTVKVTGTSKGKGFAGVVKRHGFKGGPKTHGQSDRHRAPGSIGQTTTPGRVYKGKRMAGRMGHETVAITNLTIVDVDELNKILLVSGLIPGHKKSLVLIERTGESKKFVPLLKLQEEKSQEEAVQTEEIQAEAEAAQTAPAEEVKEEKSNLEEVVKEAPKSEEKEKGK